MTLELSHTERRLLLQGIWKEQDMYLKMLNETTSTLTTDHCLSNIKTLKKLELKIIKGE